MVTTPPPVPHASKAKAEPPDPPDPPAEVKDTMSTSTNVKNSMIINMDHVVINTNHNLTYKVIRVINHFIQHVIKHYQDEDRDVSLTSGWYIKWSTIYPII